jgi:hypothetical protein
MNLDVMAISLSVLPSGWSTGDKNYSRASRPIFLSIEIAQALALVGHRRAKNCD